MRIISLWTGHPLHGGVEIPCEAQHNDDGSVTLKAIETRDPGNYVVYCDDSAFTAIPLHEVIQGPNRLPQS